MIMDYKKVLDAYMYYNARYPLEVVFYRTGDFYKPFMPDIDKISAHMPEWATSAQKDSYLVPVEKALDFVVSAHHHGLQIRLVECLNDLGEYDVPDIENIIMEAETDY